MSRRQLIAEGIVMLGVLAIWVAVYCTANPPTRDLGLDLYYSMGRGR